MQSTTNSECIPTLEFPEIPNKDKFVVSDVSSIFRTEQKVSLLYYKINPRFLCNQAL